MTQLHMTIIKHMKQRDHIVRGASGSEQRAHRAKRAARRGAVARLCCLGMPPRHSPPCPLCRFYFLIVAYILLDYLLIVDVLIDCLLMYALLIADLLLADRLVAHLLGESLLS